MKIFTIENKEISVCTAAGKDRPVIYLNTFSQERDSILAALRKMNAPDFNLVAITNLEWDHDMAPWDIPPISADDTPCTGGADDYLALLLESILPEAEKGMRGTPVWRAVAGYSLAGLFAVWAIYQTDVFSRVASMSGSLWFPGIKEYVLSHEPKRVPDCMYFSLGDKECKTRNKFLRTVQDNTEEIASYYAGKGIPSVFVLNPGNHYVNAAERTAAGLAWILER